MVTPNEVEAEELTGVHVEDLESAHKAAEYFYEKGVEKVIITLGSRGVVVSSDGKEEIVTAFKVVAALSKGKDIWEAVRFANGLAALSVQKLGTTPSMPKLEEIEAFLEEHK